MKITRRTMFTGAAGLAAVSQFSRPAWAPPALHGIQACHFNNTLLQNNTNAIPGMVSSATTMTMSVCFRIQTLGVNQIASIVATVPTAGNINYANFYFANVGGSLKIQGLICGPEPVNASTFYAVSPALNAFDGAWHWAALSIDAPGNWATFAYDGVSMPPTTFPTGSNWAGNWQRPILIGGGGISGKNVVAPYIGDLAQLQTIAGGDRVDMSDPAVLAALYDTTNEEPVIIGTRGHIGAPINQQPQISMDGPPPMFRRNNAGYPYDWDAINSPFTVIKGTLTQATLDPWGFTGE